jgi:hypothetical protein
MMRRQPERTQSRKQIPVRKHGRGKGSGAEKSQVGLTTWKFGAIVQA